MTTSIGVESYGQKGLKKKGGWRRENEGVGREEREGDPVLGSSLALLRFSIMEVMDLMVPFLGRPNCWY